MTNIEKQIVEVLESFDTWCRCGSKDCAKSDNYLKTLAKLLDIVTEVRIDEHSRATVEYQLRNETGRFMDYLNDRIKQLTPQPKGKV